MSDTRLLEERRKYLLLDNTREQNKLLRQIENEIETVNEQITKSTSIGINISKDGVTGNQGHTGEVGQMGQMGGTYTGPTGPIGHDGSQGEPGIQGPTGMQGKGTITGATGPPGEVGVTGGVGQHGPVSFTGSTGHVGKTGSVGGTGAQGQDSTVGSTGPTGKTGFQGITGPTGVMSITGSTGIIGRTGNFGITGIKGETAVTGSTGSLGPFGPQGLPSEFAITGPTGHIGSGPLGVTGETGPMGGIGKTGVLGSTGAVGHVGEASITGSTGPFGAVVNGPTGVQGSTGNTGQTGKDGQTGKTGIFGEFGITGYIGNTGSGIMGITGDRGVFAYVGKTGSMGSTDLGATGKTGPTGATGVGTRGPVGIIGPTGIGPIGVTGVKGGDSTTGSTGSIGNLGNYGPKGIYGPDSITGSTGPASVGLTGPDSIFGISGPTGKQGGKGRTGKKAGPTGGYFDSTGPTGPVGVIGITGITGKIGLDGPIGPTGKIGNVGHMGPRGPVTESVTGPPNENGGTGVIGPTGSGITGKDGPTGIIGHTGAMGKTGTNGKTGQAGGTGSTGIMGGTGKTGYTGTYFEIGGPVGTKIDVLGLQGPTGPTGSTGVDGFIGPHRDNVGNTGDPGNTGFVGHTGKTGFSQTGPQGMWGPIHPGYTGPTGHTGHIVPTKAELAQEQYKLVNVWSLGIPDHTLSIQYPSANTEMSLESRYGAFWGYRQDLWMIKDKFFLSSSSGSSDQTTGNIYDKAHIQLMNGRRQARGVNGDYFTHTPNDSDNNGAAVRPGGHITFEPQGRYRFNFTRVYFDIWSDENNSIRQYNDLKFRILASNDGANWDIMKISGKTTEDDVFYVKADMVKDENRYKPYGIEENYEESPTLKPDMYYVEFINSEFYSNWRLLHVHNDQTITQSDYMTDTTKNYFTIPNSMSEIEFGGGWVPPSSLTVTGNLDVKRPGTVVLTFNDGDPIWSSSYKTIKELTYNTGNYPKSLIRFNNRFAIDQQTNQITINDYVVATAKSNVNFYVKLEAENGETTYQPIVGTLSQNYVNTENIGPDIYHQSYNGSYTEEDYGYLPGMSGFPPQIITGPTGPPLFEGDWPFDFVPQNKIFSYASVPVFLIIMYTPPTNNQEIKVAKFRGSNRDDTWWVVYIRANTFRITRPDWAGGDMIGNIGANIGTHKVLVIGCFQADRVGARPASEIGRIVYSERNFGTWDGRGSMSSITQLLSGTSEWSQIETAHEDKNTYSGIVSVLTYQGYNHTKVAVYQGREGSGGFRDMSYREEDGSYNNGWWPWQIDSVIGFTMSQFGTNRFRWIDGGYQESSDGPYLPYGYRYMFHDWRYYAWVKIARLDAGSQEWSFGTCSYYIEDQAETIEESNTISSRNMFRFGESPNIVQSNMNNTSLEALNTINGHQFINSEWKRDGMRFGPLADGDAYSAIEINGTDWVDNLYHTRITDNFRRFIQAETMTHLYHFKKYIKFSDFATLPWSNSYTTPYPTKRPEDPRLGFYISFDNGNTWKQRYLKFIHNGETKYTDTHRFLSDVSGNESHAWSPQLEMYVTSKHYSGGLYELVDYR